MCCRMRFEQYKSCKIPPVSKERMCSIRCKQQIIELDKVLVHKLFLKKSCTSSFIATVFPTQQRTTTHWCFVSTCLPSSLWTIAAFNSVSLQIGHSVDLPQIPAHNCKLQLGLFAVYFDITAPDGNKGIHICAES